MCFSVGYKKNKAQQNATEPISGGFKKILRKRQVVLVIVVWFSQKASPTKPHLFLLFSKVRRKSEQTERKDGELDPKFWELLLSADKKDYERICAEYGVTDFRCMLKKLNEMKKEREEEQAEVTLFVWGVFMVFYDVNLFNLHFCFLF